MNHDLIENTAAYIARYLAERPAAVDTVEGVQHFWLGAQETELTLDVTRAALDLLAQRGVVEVRQVGAHAVAPSLERCDGVTAALTPCPAASRCRAS